MSDYALRRGGKVPASLRRLFNSTVRHADIRGGRELELVRRAKGGDREARAVLDQAHLPLVYLTVRRYFGHGVAEEDLIQEGRMGLQHAVGKFDESRGVTLATYAVRWIRNYAAAYLSETCADVRVAPKIRGAYGRMLREGRTQRDLAESDSPEDRALLANLSAVVPALRLDAPPNFGDDEPAHGTLADRVAVQETPADEALHRARLRSIRDALLPEVLAALTDREREVVVRRYPLDEGVEPQTQVEIAESWRGGRVTRQRIQQIESGALDKIAAHLARLDPARRILD